MTRFLFKRRFNFFDSFVISIAMGFMLSGHWVVALLAIVASAYLSVEGEWALTEDDKRYGKRV